MAGFDIASDALFEQSVKEEIAKNLAPSPVDEIVFDTVVMAYAKKDTAGKMGAAETLSKEMTGGELREKVPFAGPVLKVADQVAIAGAVERLRTWTDEDYRRAPEDLEKWRAKRPSYYDWMKALPEGHPIRKQYEAGEIDRHGRGLAPTREQDEAIVRDFLQRTYEAQIRGQSALGMGTRIAAEAVPYMAEYGLLAGLPAVQGLKSFGTRVGIKVFGKSLAGRAAASATGMVAGATGMMAIGRTPHIAAGAIERHAAGDKWASAILRSVGDQWVEMFSEQTGGLLARGGAGVLRRLPFFGRLVPRIGKAWMYKTGKSEAAFLRRLARKGGFSGIIGELGEERVGTQLRAILNVEDFGAGKDANIIQRMAAGLKQDMKSLLGEAIGFGIIGGGQSAAMHTAGAAGTMAYRSQMHANFKANVKNDPLLFFMMNPAEAKRLAEIEQPTRKDFENIPGRWSAEERAEMAGRLRELSPLFDVDAKDLVRLVQEGLSKGLSVQEAQRWAAQTAAERKRMGLPVVAPAETETPAESEVPDDTQDTEGLQGREPQGQESGGAVQEPPPSREETGPGGVLQGEGPGGEVEPPPPPETQPDRTPTSAEEAKSLGWHPIAEHETNWHFPLWDVQADENGRWWLTRAYKAYPGPFVGSGGALIPVMELDPETAALLDRAKQHPPFSEEAKRLRNRALARAKLIYKLIYEGQQKRPQQEPQPEPQTEPPAPPEPEPSEPEPTPSRLFHQRVAERLRSGGAISNQDIADWSREAFGAAAGTARDAYDVMESAVHAYAEDMLRDLPPDQWLSALIALQDRLPTQTRRDERQVEFQQFSTPPGIAGLAVLASGIRSGAVALEPSAGTGALAHLMRAAGADVTANEIDERRRSLLLDAGFDTRNVDAEFLDNNLPEGETYDVIVMNPPFSATGGRLKRHDTKYGAEHVRHALLRLRPGGRLVAIVGRGMARNRPKFGDWWKKIEARYNVRANIGLKGDLYAKYGTRFPVQIVVIDNTGPTESVSNEILGEDMSLEEAAQALAGLMGDDIHGRVLSTSKPGGTTPGKKPVSPARPQGGQPGGTPHGGGGGAAPGGVGEIGEGGQGGPATPRPGGAAPQVARPGVAAGPGVSEPGGGPGSVEGDRGPGGGRPGGESQRPGETTGVSGGAREGGGAVVLPPVEAGEAKTPREKKAPQEKAVAEESRPYSSYVVQKASVAGAKPHPAKLVESTTLASVEPPEPTITLHLPRKLIESGVFSAPQLEAIIYAVQSHEQILPGGSTAGFWLGDGTGTGKTRIILGVIYEHYLRGKKKAVIVSAKRELVEQARKDAGEIGYTAPILSQNDVHADDAIDMDEGIVFSSYRLIGGDWKKNKRRFTQLVNWMGEDFDGAIVFDESHLMKNAAMQRDEAQAEFGQGTNAGEFGIQLQRMFPRAKLVYASATGASEIRHLIAYERLGLWGPGQYFETFTELFEALHRGGLAGFEALTASLKSMGRYVARSISYADVVEDSVSVRREPTLRDKEIYDRAAEFWRKLYDAWTAAQQNAHAPRDMKQYYAAQQRFFLGLITGLMVPDVIRAAEKDIAEGRAPVITLFKTGEAAMERGLAAAGGRVQSEELYDFASRSSLVDLIENFFPVTQYIQVTDPDTGRTTWQEAGINAENVRVRQQLIEMVSELELPPNAMDQIVEHFGPDRVAEISGRNRRMEYGKYVPRKVKGVPKKILNLHELRMFQEGKKDVAIFTSAGGIGYDAHAGNDVPNKKQRVLYALELSWSADQQLQIFGRVHRSNQASAPILRLVTLQVAGGKRLYNAVCRRLSGLGAATQGEREAFSGSMFEAEDITDHYGQAALSSLYATMRNGVAPGMDRDTLEVMGVLDNDGNVQRDRLQDVEGFLNRIMVLPVDQQNRLFEEFYRRYVERVEEAKAKGEFDFGVQEIHARDLTANAEPVTVWTEPVTGATAELQTLTGMVPVNKVAWEQGLRWADGGFWRNKRSGHIWAARGKGGGGVFSMLGPRGTSDSQTIADLRERYEEVKNAEAMKWWQETLESIPDTQEATFYLGTGMPFFLWTDLHSRWPQQIKRPAMKRAKLADGTTLLGLELPKPIAKRLLREAGSGPAETGSKAADIEDRLESGQVVTLSNTWMLGKSRIMGDAVLEVTATSSHYDQLKRLGFQEEIINYRKRFFVPWGEESKAMIEKLAKSFDIEERGETLAFAGGPSPARPRPSVPGEKQRKIPTPQQIAKTVEKLFGFPALVGRVGGRPAGIFKTHERVARVKQQYLDSVGILVHEVGHGLDITHGILKDAPQAVRAELESLDYEPEKGRAREGLAEYIRHLVWDQDAETVAPTVDAWFRQWLIDHPDIFHAIDVFADLVQTWRQATSLERGLAQISTDRKVRRPANETINERLGSMFRDGLAKFYIDWKDVGHAFRLVQEAGQKSGYSGWGTGKGPYDMYMALAMTGPTQAAAAIEKGVFLMTGDMQRIGPSLADVYEGITPDRLSLCNLFAYARHCLEAHEKGTGYNPGLSKADAEQIVAELDCPEFRRSAERMTEYHNALLLMLVDVGVLSPEIANKAIKAWKTYVPLTRLVDVERRHGKHSSVAWSPLKYRSKHGSGLPIIDPAQALVERTIVFYARAAEQIPINALIEGAEQHGGMGKWVHRVPPKSRREIVWRDDVLEQMQKKLSGKLEEGDVQSVMDVLESALDEPQFLFLWRPVYRASAHENIVMVYRNGKQELYYVHPYIYQALERMRGVQMHWFLQSVDAVLGPIARGVRLGATGLNIAFAMHKNPVKDYLVFLAQSREGAGAAWNALPINMTRRYLFSQWRDMQGKEEDPVVELWKQMGGPLATYLGMDMKRIRRAVEDSMRDPVMKKFLRAARNPIDAMRDFMTISEVGPRLAEFEAVLKRHGYDHARLVELSRQGRRPPREVLIEAINNANDVTVNFKRMGYYGAVLNRWVPFFNARLEGTDKYVRTWATQPLRALAVTSAYAAIAASYWALVNDDDWYKDSPPWLRYGYWAFPDANGKVILRLPRPHAWDLIGGGMVQAMLDRWKEKQPEYARAWAKMVVKETGLPLHYSDITPPLIKEGIEIARNKTFFGERPIVPSYMTESLMPADQVTDRTGAFTKWFVGLYNDAVNAATDDPVRQREWQISPAKVQHLLHGITGGLYTAVTESAEKTLQGEGLELAKRTLYTGFSLARQYSESIGQFYDRREAVTLAYGSAKKRGKVAPELAAERYRLEQYARLMSEIRRAIESIEDPDARWEAGEKYIVGLAREALGLEELQTRPSPLGKAKLPGPVKEAVEDFLGSKLYQLTDARPERERGESVEEYRDRLKAHEEAIEAAKAILPKMSRAQMVALLRKEAARRGYRTEVLQNGKLTRFGQRLQRLP